MRHSRLASLLAPIAVAAALAVAAVTVAPIAGYAQVYHQSLLRVGDGQVRQIKLGLNKSMIVELPRAVREVMVSNPDQIDAVMQSATRAYLIGKNSRSQHSLHRQCRQPSRGPRSDDRARSRALEDLIARLIPGSRVHVETVGQNVVLTGSVPTPIDATRASEIVNSFLDSGASPTSNSAAGGGAAITINNSGSGATGGDEGSNRVINMITVEGREQVLLRVSVVEMERNVVKQLGVDLAALVNSGNFGFAALSALPYPINGAVGAAAGGLLGAGGLPGLVDSRPGAALAGAGWSSGTSHVDAVLRALEQNGLIHTLAESRTSPLSPAKPPISSPVANFRYRLRNSSIRSWSIQEVRHRLVLHPSSCRKA